MPPVNLISSTGSSLLDQNTEILQHEADIPSLHLLHQTSSIKTSLSMLSTLKRQLFTGNSKPDAEPVQNDLKPLPSEEKSIQQSHNDLTAHSVEDANTVKIKRFHLSPSSEYVDSVRQYSADGGSNAASKTSSDVPNALRSSKYYNSQADLQNSKFTWLSSRPTSEDVSATVSPGNRQVTTTNNHHCGVNASAIGNPSDDDVSLELSIGPAKRMPTTHLTKSIEAIRSKDRSGFSKWSRAELDSEGADCRPGQTSLCNSGGCEIQEESNDRGNFCKCSTFLRLAQDPAMSLTSNTKNRSMAPECTLLAAGQHSNEPITPYFVRWINSGTLGQWPSRERNIPVASQATITNKLLEAAFGPCEVATKMCKLNNSDHVRVHYLQRDDVTANIDTLNSSGNFGKSEEWTYITDQSKNFQTTDHVKCEADCVQNKTRSSKGAKRLRYHVKLGMPCNIRRSLELPNVVQEKTLVEFLQAKKQQKEHFLDKVVVKEDVYQSHPWHFTSGGTGVSGDGTVGGCGGSLYFCCSTKYTKRGNMTRNRMTREGGRWKQQGMVQPIFYGRGDVEAAHKTYLSYIPRGSPATSASAVTSSTASCRASFFIDKCLDENNKIQDVRHESLMDCSSSVFDSSTATRVRQGASTSTAAGRLKHRHRMIEIALQEDLILEKRSFQLKITPKPFLVVCILRNTA